MRTEDGLVLTGFFVSEDDDVLVLREAAGGQEFELEQQEIEVRVASDISAMPAGLVNQLSSREQFLDLVSFLMEVDEQGAERQAELKRQVTDR